MRAVTMVLITLPVGDRIITADCEAITLLNGGRVRGAEKRKGSRREWLGLRVSDY